MASIEKFLGRRVDIPEDRRYHMRQGLWAKSDGKKIIVGLTEPALVLAGGLNDLDWLVPNGQAVSEGKAVAVVGGGDTAVEEALYLSKIVEKVYLIHRRNELRASKILQQRVISECKIEILWNTVVTAINADDQSVSAVDLKNTETGKKWGLPTHGIVIFIGYIPNNQLVPVGVKMNADGYVLTNEKCETNIAGIYVIGDLREKYAKQIVLAAADGCNAALATAHYVEGRKSSEEVCEPPKEMLTTS